MKRAFGITTALLLISFIPIFILGENSYIRITDNLDSEFVNLHVLKITHSLFEYSSSEKILNIFNGLPVRYFHTEFSVIRILFYLLPSFWAYVLNSIIVRFIGLIGMILLFRDYYKNENYNNAIVILLSLSFALLPVYTLYGLSVLGQPLLLWSFYNLKHKRKVISSLSYIFLFPFYTHFAMTAPFILIALFSYGFLEFYDKIKTLKYRTFLIYLSGIILLMSSFVIANYLTIENFLVNGELSHRSDRNRITPSFLNASYHSLKTLFTGQYHSSSFFGIPIIIVACYLFFKNQGRSIIKIFSLIVSIALFHGFYRMLSIEKYSTILTAFQLNRFTILLPILVFLMVLKTYKNQLLPTRYMYILVITFFIGNIYKNNELIKSVKNLFITLPTSKQESSFKSFFAEELYQEIEDYIKIPQVDYRIVSLGIQPSIATYNGFYTLDSYQNNYPLEHKKLFRKIIHKELDKHSGIKRTYDDWGNACYLYSAELDYCDINCAKKFSSGISNLDIDTNGLKKMKCKYIFSSVRIKNTKDLNINFERVFTSKKTPLKIFLYQLI